MSMALGALKSFVAEPTGQKQADDTVVLHVTHSNLSHHFNELRFDLHVSVGHLPLLALKCQPAYMLHFTAELQQHDRG